MATSTQGHLIVLCCHGIWAGGPSKGHEESEWLIADFQKGEPPTFIEHIKSAIKVLQRDLDAILVISGGPTRKETRLSEAESYRRVAAANELFGVSQEIRESLESRIILDEQALDSYHNILCSLVSFWRHTGSWPSKMTIVSHGFKRERIVDGHCTAINFPLSRVEYVGIDPPGMIPLTVGGEVSKSDAMEGERRAVDQWKGDPHGVGSVLAGKRVKRNVWGIDQTFFRTEEERKRSGLITRRLDYGREAVIDDEPRPWAFGG